MIAVFYHCLIRNDNPPVHASATADILGEQMRALKDTGLAEAADHVFIGVNGDENDRLQVKNVAPEKAEVMAFAGGETELTTMGFMQKWLRQNHSAKVCYHHMKGASNPNYDLHQRWRRRMESFVIGGWRLCTAQLDMGFDSCGCHFLEYGKHPVHPGQRYWAGNFWWATSDYLLTLPELPPDARARRYDAESWIGSGPKRPVIKDFYRGWPA